MSAAVLRKGRALSALSLLLLGLACAPPAARSPGSPNPQIITAGEIDALNASTAHDAIQKLRPNFLSYRGETSLNKSQSSPYPTVYVDGIAFGPIESLRTISAMEIATIRLYRSWEATTKFGMGNMGGVIEITTKQ